MCRLEKKINLFNAKNHDLHIYIDIFFRPTNVGTTVHHPNQTNVLSVYNII